MEKHPNLDQQWCENEAQDVPKSALKNGAAPALVAKRPQEASKRPPRRSKRRPREAQEGPKTAQEVPQRGPSGPQERPKRVPLTSRGTQGT